jgi:hypothetical protein
LADLVDL